MSIRTITHHVLGSIIRPIATLWFYQSRPTGGLSADSPAITADSTHFTTDGAFHDNY